MKNYIIHVSTDFEREKHIRKEIAKTSFDFTFINKGDIKDLTTDILAQYFVDMSVPSIISCAYKHILVYKDMIDNQVDYAIILEDDIYLYKNFEKKITEIVDEIKERKLSNFLISLEESTLQYVKGSEREKRKLLYLKKHGRCTGAYIIDIESAKAMMREIETHKCNTPIDWLHNIHSEKGLINIYWAHPPIAIQGSLNGKIMSMIDTRHKRSENLFRRISFAITKFYKKTLYGLR